MVLMTKDKMIDVILIERQKRLFERLQIVNMVILDWLYYKIMIKQKYRLSFVNELWFYKQKKVLSDGCKE